MDQEEKMDFKALRAKFQDEELLLKQPRIKPSLPEKPKAVPPPQSPTHYLPAGARPSLLTSINQSVEGKTLIAPRVVFKDEKKESKKPLLQNNTKKDKSEGKQKKSKDKSTKESKEKLEEDSSAKKHKKENSKDKKFSLVLPVAPKESTAELVPAIPPPKATATKKGFLGLKKSAKRDSLEVQADPILDTPSLDVPGQAPLIPVPSDFVGSPTGPETSTPKALLPNIPTLPGSNAAVEITPPFIMHAAPSFTPPPAFIPDTPVPESPTQESETPCETETNTLSISRPSSQNEIIPNSSSTVPTPPSTHVSKIVSEAFNIDVEERPPPPSLDSLSSPPSPKAVHSISALSALERAEDMSSGKRTPPCDRRIFNALEKARRKASQPINPATSYSNILPKEDLPPSPQSPTCPLPALPPIDYEDQARSALPKPAQVNGIHHRQASPVLEGITEEGSNTVPELLVVPPPPPRKVHKDPSHLHKDYEIHPPQFSENGIMGVSEFNDAGSDAHSPELPASDLGRKMNTGPDTPDGQNIADIYSSRIITPAPEINAAPASGDQNTSLSESPSLAGLKAQVLNGVYESTENIYEDISTSKKKGKTEGGKKRKGPPKNPYAETPQETVSSNEEKSKTGRFGKNDKKAEGPDEKELKKKEKQRLEKEKKELKEKQEKEKKEQKEREKRETEMKKKFQITGQEDTMYEAKVNVTTKGRKNDLPVKSGDIISIVRTTNCPKGKWLARDSSNNYGYVAVDHVELDIKEMLELGKKAANTHKSINSAPEVNMARNESRASNHFPHSAESFTDDSEEWTADDDEPLSPPPASADPLALMGHTRTLSMPDMANKELSINHQHSRSDISADNGNIQARHEALQKLATFFHSTKPVEPAVSSTEPETRPVLVMEDAVPLPQAGTAEEMDFEQPDMLILPPPDLYADFIKE